VAIAEKVFVIGLDCAAPELVFDAWRDDLPNLARLMAEGSFGELQSITPPITVPAWMSMMTSKDPGTLGIYGFRNRGSHAYGDQKTANSTWVKEDTVWDILSRQGKQVVVVGVPATYPPKPVNGSLVGCFLTPTIKSQYTYPAQLKDEIAAVVGEYQVDVPNFRTEDRDDLMRQIYEMTDKRFTLVKHLMKTKPWDFFIFVEMGTDRLHHAMWQFWDKQHFHYQPGNPYEDTMRQYYIHLDRLIGDLLAELDGQTAVLVVSDHGAKRIDGGICFNEWLIREGYLVLKSKPEGVVPLDKCEVDWARTTAWGDGGYYGRLFVNVRGREPQGIVAPEDYERVRAELTAKLEALTDHQGRHIGTRVYKPEQIYQTVRGVAPDLIVIFGDLYWRSIGTIGRETIYVFENDSGPDGANHAENGLFIARLPGAGGRGRVEGRRLLDIAPTVLRTLDIDVPADMQGTPFSLNG
jgi:predicted AlkP superfamily phosphohydrolase/phosphomutase